MYRAYYNWEKEAYAEAQRILKENSESGYTSYYYDQTVYYIHLDFRTDILKEQAKKDGAMWADIGRQKGWPEIL